MYAEAGVVIDDVTKGFCSSYEGGTKGSTNDYCEVYVKKGTLNGKLVKTGTDYCNAIGLTCDSMYDDQNDCRRLATDPPYTCDTEEPNSSDHIVRCTRNPTTRPTALPSSNPTKGPTAVPTVVPTAIPTTPANTGALVSGSSHGDPIIHTFKDDCYDLNKDGLYLASSHPDWTHDVKVAVYNDYIREIQITNYEGDILYSISNLKETTGSWGYGSTYRERMCEETTKECEFILPQFGFDVQLFKYTVQILSHDYLDPALKDGETGVHLDIYPRPFNSFRKEEYSGLYFYNPNPHVLGRCPS